MNEGDNFTPSFSDEEFAAFLDDSTQIDTKNKFIEEVADSDVRNTLREIGYTTLIDDPEREKRTRAEILARVQSEMNVPEGTSQDTYLAMVNEAMDDEIAKLALAENECIRATRNLLRDYLPKLEGKLSVSETEEFDTRKKYLIAEIMAVHKLPEDSPIIKLVMTVIPGYPIDLKSKEMADLRTAILHQHELIANPLHFIDELIQDIPVSTEDGLRHLYTEMEWFCSAVQETLINQDISASDQTERIKELMSHTRTFDEAIARNAVHRIRANLHKVNPANF